MLIIIAIVVSVTLKGSTETLFLDSRFINLGSDGKLNNLLVHNGVYNTASITGIYQTNNGT